VSTNSKILNIYNYFKIGIVLCRHLVPRKEHVGYNCVQQIHDKIRYQYDDHYFITDPDEFIQEFWAHDPDWQLLEVPISLEQFEEMPFVRSVFFHYVLEFSKPMKAILNTDENGRVDIRLIVPEDLAHSLVFHYQLRFANDDQQHPSGFKVGLATSKTLAHFH